MPQGEREGGWKAGPGDEVCVGAELTPLPRWRLSGPKAEVVLLTDGSPYGPREITATPSEVEGACVCSRRGWVQAPVGQPCCQELLLEELVSGESATVSLAHQPTGSLILVNSRIPAKGNRALEADLFSHPGSSRRGKEKTKRVPRVDL